MNPDRARPANRLQSPGDGACFIICAWLDVKNFTVNPFSTACWMSF
jgi:hypothetical protein